MAFGCPTPSRLFSPAGRLDDPPPPKVVKEALRCRIKKASLRGRGVETKLGGGGRGWEGAIIPQ